MLTIGWPQQVCAAGKSTSTPRRRSSRHDGLPGVGEQRVVDAGDHQGHPHAGHPRTRRRSAASQSRLVAGARGGGRRGSRGPGARIAARSGRSAPSARAWTSTLPSAAASTGPASTGRPQASAVSWQSSVVAGAAADDVHDVDARGRPAGRRCGRCAPVGEGEAVEDAAGDLAGRLRAAARRRRAPADDALGHRVGGMSPGEQERVVDVDDGAQRRRGAGAGEQEARSVAGVAAVAPRPERTPRAPRGPSRCVRKRTCRRRRPRW